MKATSEPANQENDDEIRVSEYETLRTELLENKRYVFERPLAIVAAAGIAGMQLDDKTFAITVPLFLIWILLINLWFTVNRLRSNARIIAYLNLTIEPHNPITWIGWESSLRLHRRWMKKYECKENEMEKEIEQFLDEDAKPDAMVFYPAVLGLHLAPVIFSVIASLLLLRGDHGPTSILLCVLTVASALIFMGFAISPWNPEKMKGLIERHRATWLAVFDKPTRAKPASQAVLSKAEKPEKTSKP